MSENRKSDSGLVVEKIAWHSFPLGDVFLHLNSKRDGLSESDAAKRLKNFGPNTISEKRRYSWGLAWANKLGRVSFWLIAVAAGLLAWGGAVTEAVVLFVVLLVLSGGEIIQEFFIFKLAGRGCSGAKIAVKREGVCRLVLASEIVPGEVILFQPGDIIPADARLIRSFSLTLDETFLGPAAGRRVVKAPAALPAAASFGQKTNIIFGGTAVTGGSGEAVVFDTGANSEIFQRKKSLAGPKPLSILPFGSRLRRLNWFTAAAAAIFSAIVLGQGFMLGQAPDQFYLWAAVLIVAVSPQACLAVWPMIVSQSLRKILKKEVSLVSPGCLENLSEAGVILLERTGVLSDGQLEVAKILTPERVGGVFNFNAAPQYGTNHLLVLSYGILAAETIEPFQTEQGLVLERSVAARSLGQALIKSGAAASLDWEKLNQKFKKINAVTFNHHRRFGISFRENQDKETWALVLGSPEVLLGHVKKIQIINRAENIIPLEFVELKNAAESLARSGFKTTAVCAKRIEDKSKILGELSDEKIKKTIDDLTLVGLIAFKDNLRPETKSGLLLARRLGLKTVLLTSEPAPLALATARQAGLLPPGRNLPEAMAGQDVAVMDLRELSHKIRNIEVFYGLNPEHKLKILKAWQLQDEKVAVWGDHVDDYAFAVQSEAAVASAGAAEIIKKNSAVIIPHAGYAGFMEIIRESRLVLKRLKQLVVFVFSLALGEAVFLFFSRWLSPDLPIKPAQFLWANFIFAALAMLALSFSKIDRSPAAINASGSDNQRLVDSAGLFLAIMSGLGLGLILTVVSYFFKTYFESDVYARSVVFASLTLAIFCLAYTIFPLPEPVWKSRFPGRGFVWFVVIGLALAGALIYTPGLNSFFGLQPIGFWEWLVIAGALFLNGVLASALQWLHISYRGRNRLR